MAKPKYNMTISLNVLKHLGINLYSNIPAVLSEAVANAWDADANKVEIEVKNNKIAIRDNGHGMTVKDANAKYLLVGYERRKDTGQATTKKYKRKVMGRKGIGKLSLFSIASTVKLYSKKNKEKHGFILSAKKIEEMLKKKDGAQYHPEPIPKPKVDFKKWSTVIVLTDLKKSTSQTVAALRKRVARRFGIIGAEHNFSVKVNNKEVSIVDRDYFHKLQNLWYYGIKSKKYSNYCDSSVLKHNEKRPNKISSHYATGWIGTVENSGSLKDGDDSLNKIVIMVRGKLAQEDILEDFAEGGIYTKYLIGEIHADFLDADNKEDISTSNRQEIKKADPRYLALKKWVHSELKHIEKVWSSLREKKGTEKACQIPAIQDWFATLKSPQKRKAERLFGKINQLLVKEDEKKQLFKHSVLAFESLRYKESLDALDKLSPQNTAAFVKIFIDCDDIEAALYHQIVKERLQIIEKLHSQVGQNALEKVVQKHLYNHLWLLDPSWDRATETPYMEQTVTKEFKKINVKLTAGEKRGRVDIKYKTTSGKHLIIELKRANRHVADTELMEQVSKYHEALRKVLKAAGRDREPIEIICIVGKELKNWTDPSTRNASVQSLAAKNIRIVTYEQLINDAYRCYSTFLEKNKEAGRVSKLIEDIEQQS